MNSLRSPVGLLLSMTFLSVVSITSEAFPTYSNRTSAEDPVGGRCSNCHGDFNADAYISRTDGKNWGNLHNLHRLVMLEEDDPNINRCRTCHMPGPPGPPVFTFQSGGNGVLDPISCVGCHGRYEDATDETEGMGAGLRQHHWNAGITFCGRCHEDADPDDFAPAGEQTLPPYYFPDGIFVNKPTDPCNVIGGEDYAGLLWGLDNDGDGKYDIQDSDCTPPETLAICHTGQGGNQVERTIAINIKALPAHTRHGDALGACE